MEENNTDRSINALTLTEVADMLKISRRTVERMIRKGRIPAFKLGGQWRILESRFEEWLKER